MKTFFLMAVLSLTTSLSLFADGTNVLTGKKERSSYAIGMMIGSSWKRQGIELDDDLFLRGLKDQQSGAPTLLTKEEMQATIQEFQKEFNEKLKKKRAEQAIKNKADGEAFLAENKTKPGVQILPVTLPDGKTYELQYIVITNGTGATPTSNSLVTVNYRGTLIDGTEFDSTARAGRPAQFQVNRVMRGWTEAVTRMKVGSKWKLFIPAALAYGEQGQGNIPPNATLIFEVELLDSEAYRPPAPITSDVIKVPSADSMKKGAKIETIKSEDVQKLQSQSKTN
jgi:FKBP-type peptidyl-prolyl cis-trans isomerase FklB